MGKRLKLRFNAPVTLSFVSICFVATLLGIASNGEITKTLFMTYHSSFLNPMTYVRFVTHVFGHVGWSHFIGNASYLLLLGPMLEEKYGSKNLLICIIITALVTGILNNLFFKTALLGASGIVFMMIVMSSFTSLKSGTIPLTFILILIFIFYIN